MTLHRTLTTVAVAAALMLAGCGDQVWPQESNPMTTVDPITDMGVAIQSVYGMITWWTLAIGVLVCGLLVYVLVTFRDKGQKENPQQIHGNPALEIGWTLIPVVIVIFIIVPTVRTIFLLGDAAPEDSLAVKVVGKRWWWEFQYVPDGDMVKEEIVTGNELHMPVNRTLSLLITSDSVIHSFWAPRLGGKRDAVPGRTNRMWLTLLPPCGQQEEGQACSDEQPADGKPLYYGGECAEFCGEAHAQMKFDVVIHTEKDFRAWADAMVAPTEPEDPKAKEGKELFGELGCGGCHAITGHERARGILGPNLTNFWYMENFESLKGKKRIAASGHAATPESLKAWIADPDSIKPGATSRFNISRGSKYGAANDGMNVPVTTLAQDTDGDGYPNFSDDQLDKLVAYLTSLK